ALRRKTGQSAGSTRPDAEPEDGNGDRGRGQGYQRNQSRQGGVSRRQDGHHPRPGWQSELFGREAGGKRGEPDYGGNQGETGGGQRQVREKRHGLLHDGPGRETRYLAVQCEGGRLKAVTGCSHEKEGRQE